MFRCLLLSAILLTPAAASAADDPPEIHLVFLGDRFDPAELPVPAGVKFVLRIDNKTGSPMEWESLPLRREKIVATGASATIFIGPLKPGSYEYFDDFHPQVRGQLVAR